MSKSKKEYGDNIKPLTYQEMFDYLSFLDKTIFDLVERRKVYSDVHASLIKQKAKLNPFIYWMMNNYYQTLILTLCRIFEPKKYDDDRKTLKHFINSLKEECNYSIIKDKIDTAQIEYHCDDGSIDCEDISEIMIERLESINFDNDIKTIEDLLAKIEKIRNKQIAHSTEVEIKKEDQPEIKELHQYVDKLIKIVKAYHSLFRYSVDYGEEHQNIYYDFHLFLK